MGERTFSSTDVAWIAGARGLAGAGLGLLLAGLLRRGHRTGAGWALLISGALMSAPLFVDRPDGPREPEREERPVLVA